jgi:hypothetical protein
MLVDVFLLSFLLMEYYYKWKHFQRITWCILVLHRFMSKALDV